MAAVETTASAELSNFQFSQYSWIGFDLDHTLVRYHLQPFFELCYRVFVKWLCRAPDSHVEGGGGFPPEWFACPMNRAFAVKGTVLDMRLGNVILLDEDCHVIRAYHGWTPEGGAVPLSPFQLKKAYPDPVPFDSDPKTYNVLSTYFVTVWAQIFAVLVYRLDLARHVSDDDDDDNDEARFPDVYAHVDPGEYDYSGVLRALFDTTMAQFGYWDQGDYFPAIAADPDRYLQRNQLRPWLIELRRASKLFVCTNSLPEYTELLLRHSFGADWLSCFDLVITNGTKPAFFTADRDFYEWRFHPDAEEPAARVEQLPEPVDHRQIAYGHLYAFGSARKLVAALRRLDGVPDDQHVSLLYAGDHIESDCLAPIALSDMHTTWHTIAIVEELEDLELDFPHISLHPVVSRSAENATSAAHNKHNQFWSCFFVNYGSRKLTLFGRKASEATLSVPSLDRLSLFRPSEPLTSDHSIAIQTIPVDSLIVVE